MRHATLSRRRIIDSSSGHSWSDVRGPRCPFGTKTCLQTSNTPPAFARRGELNCRRAKSLEVDWQIGEVHFSALFALQLIAQVALLHFVKVLPDPVEQLKQACVIHLGNLLRRTLRRCLLRIG